MGVGPRRGVTEQPHHWIGVALADAVLVEGVALQRAAGGGVVDGALVVIDQAQEVLRR